MPAHTILRDERSHEGTWQEALRPPLAVVAIVGSAGLSSLIGEDDCFDAYSGPIPPRSEGVIGAPDFSLWPPGTVCRTEVGDVTFETGGDPTGFLVLFVLSLGIIAVSFRSPTPADLGARFAMSGVIGLSALGIGGMFDMPNGGMGGILLAPFLAYPTELALLGRPVTGSLSGPGTLAALASVAWVIVGTTLWLAGLGSAGFACALAMLAALAVISTHRGSTGQLSTQSRTQTPH